MRALNQLAGTAIGKAVLWLCAFLAIAVAVMVTLVFLLKAELRLKDAEMATEVETRKGIETALSFQSQMIDANRVDYEDNLKIAQDKNSRVDIRYRDRVIAIYQWKQGESNVTCDNLVDALDSYQY